ncbi:hypothetical protein SY87_21010 [Burkholderia pseudomallei]|nr:hypothetical protein SY87_21010 [Burkholderia pseudomallei]
MIFDRLLLPPVLQANIGIRHEYRLPQPVASLLSECLHEHFPPSVRQRVTQGRQIRQYPFQTLPVRVRQLVRELQVGRQLPNLPFSCATFVFQRFATKLEFELFVVFDKCWQREGPRDIRPNRV